MAPDDKMATYVFTFVLSAYNGDIFCWVLISSVGLIVI